jgi:alpha-D-ribose 1-methylphosphonate 5-triphosphate synthase subunit PhnG
MVQIHSDVQLPERKRIMGLLAKANLSELATAWDSLSTKPKVLPVRGPEVGLVMVRSKTGGTGQPFNLGEVAVSRATVMIEGGAAGHAHVLGNQPQKARLAAIFDALAQMPETTELVYKLLERIARRVGEEQGKQARETASTRVDFFTMVRGED